MGRNEKLHKIKLLLLLLLLLLVVVVAAVIEVVGQAKVVAAVVVALVVLLATVVETEATIVAKTVMPRVAPVGVDVVIAIAALATVNI